MRKRIHRVTCACACLVLLAAFTPAGATGTYQEPGEFVAEAFSGAVPKPQRLQIDETLAGQIKQVMEHDLGRSRIRYWRDNDRSVWILEEIGKTQPITTGVIVKGDRVEKIKVLVFRESRGWEVRYPFFTDQFKGAGMDREHHLDKPIDGISGATLSVRALEKVAKLALLLHRHIGLEKYSHATTP